MSARNASRMEDVAMSETEHTSFQESAREQARALMMANPPLTSSSAQPERPSNSRQWRPQPKITVEVDAAAAAEAGISHNQIQALRLQAMGWSMAESAEKLGLAVRTIELYRGVAARKLGAQSPTHAIAVAVAYGVLIIRSAE